MQIKKQKNAERGHRFQLRHHQTCPLRSRQKIEKTKKCTNQKRANQLRHPKKMRNKKQKNRKIMETSKKQFSRDVLDGMAICDPRKKKYMKKCRKTIKNKKTVTTIFSRDVLDGMAICELCIHKFNNEMFTNQHACAQE